MRGFSIARGFSLQAALRIFIFFCIAAALLFTFGMFTFSYFWWDDFNNLSMIQPWSVWTLLWHTVNPLALKPVGASFRPAGMLFYRIHWVLFDLNPLPYHVFQWVLHSINVLLVYLLLNDLLETSYAAAFGAMLFTFQGVFFEVYWDFWAIFELLSALLFLLGLWIYVRRGNSREGIFLGSVVYFVAVQTKEMAITLPAIWLLYEFTIGKFAAFPYALWNKMRLPESARELLNLAKRFLIPVALALFFTFLKVSTFAGMDVTVPYNPEFPYYMSVSLGTLTKGYAWYFDALCHTHLGWPGWILILALTLALLLFFRARLALFFVGYVFVSFIPVVILPNHRFAYYWYIPFFGICGLAALVVKQIQQRVTRRIPSRWGLVFGGVIFAMASAGNFLLQRQATFYQRAWAKDIAKEYRNFMVGLRTLPPPEPNETLYYRSVPRFFDETSTTSATQVAFRRTDLKARIVSEFPPESKYRLRFDNLTVSLEKESSPSAGAGRNAP